MELIITLTVCLLASFLFTLLARKLHISSVVGLIIGGIVLGSSFLEGIILEPNTELILTIGDAGLIVLMFLAGLEISWKNLCEEKKKAATISIFAFIIPVVLGFAVFYLSGFPFVTSLIIGICMSITAEATNAEVLMEMKKLKTKVASLMMGAGIIDDLMGMFLFMIVSFWLAHTLITNDLTILIGSISSFFAGMVAHRFLRKEAHRVHYAEKVLLNLVVPFFFIAMGIHFSLQSIAVNPMLLVIVIAIAIIGKISGSLLTKPFTKLDMRQLYLVGWGMNSRGAVELAIAFTAYTMGLIDNNVYSSLVVMALFTTLIFPFFVRRMIRKNPRVME